MSGVAGGAALGDALGAAPAVRCATTALDGADEAWIVGGAVRDAVLGRPVVDVDLAVAAEPADLAAKLAAAARGPAFELSAQFETWRVLGPGNDWHIDVTRLRGDRIEADLARRDFTANAIAVPLRDPTAVPIDPTGGLRDLDAAVLRQASSTSFADDPLRILRAARLAAALGFALDAETAQAARALRSRAGEPAGERQFAELRLLVAGTEPLRGLELLDELDATAAVLPELEALRGIEQTPYHHLDAHGHTIEVLRRLLEVEHDLPAYTGESAGAVADLLAAPLADELTRGGALRFVALFHDFGKAETRTVSEEGRVMFLGHDRVGARIIRELCVRLRTSRRLSDYLANLTLHHLTLGFLVHRRPLSRRDLFDYLRATEPDPVDVTLFTVADRLATRSERVRPEAIEAHLALAREVIAEALGWIRDGAPSAPLPGDELAAALGIEPGPRLGRLLDEIEAAVFTGDVTTPGDAIALGRRLLAEPDSE
ncbi:MAG: HD domain-containing protein [Solirubrobacterales bacterium]